MTKEDIVKKLEEFGFSGDSGETQLNHYTTTGVRSSLTKEQVTNRNSTGWGRGEYIIIEYKQDDKTQEELITGWKKLAEKYKNQYLILGVSEDRWKVFDYDGNELGGNDYIEDLFTKNTKTNESLQKIFYGCPGTGKSYRINEIVKTHLKNDEQAFRTYLEANKLSESAITNYLGVMKTEWVIGIATKFISPILSLYDIDNPNILERIKKDKEFIKRNKTGRNMYSASINHYLKLMEIQRNKNPMVFRTTFHPDTDYASFVGCYKPSVDANDKIRYTFRPQIFTDAYIAAWANLKRKIYLVIEEINRGNCAQIFGDLFQLLDRKNGYSEYSIKADNDLADYIELNLGKDADGIRNRELRLPPNLIIYATMNTSDQSLFPMDCAFKRRWEWEYIPINTECPKSQFTINIGGEKYPWADFIERVNKEILDLTESEDKQLGNFFIKGNIGKEEFKSKVMFYLWSEVCKDYYKSGSFFKYKKDGKVEEFTFNMLFDKKGNDTNILRGFMETLEVKPIAKPQDDTAPTEN